MDLDAFGAKAVEAATGKVRRLGEGDDNPPEAGGEDGVDAGRGLSVVRTGLEGDVEGAAACPFASVGQRYDLRVGPAVCGVVSLAGKLALGVDNNGSDHGVRGCATPPQCGEVEGAVHPAVVGVVGSGSDGTTAGSDPRRVCRPAVVVLWYARFRPPHSIHLSNNIVGLSLIHISEPTRPKR